MERATPVRKSHTSTAGLLVWPENQNSHSSPYDSSTPRSSNRMPSDGVSKVLCGAQVTEEEEAQSLSKLKPCSGYKMREMTGSGIFVGDGENGGEEAGTANQTPNRTGLRIYQQAVTGISQISFSVEESVSPKKPTSQAEVAKQRELSGTLETEADMKLGVLSSKIKWQELSGHDIFGPPPEIPIRPLDARALALKGSINMGESVPGNLVGGQSAATFSEETPVKTAKKINNQKFHELTGNDIFRGDTPSGTTERSQSNAKLREMSGSNIFSDGKAVSRDHLGARKPPGGDSSIALV